MIFIAIQLYNLIAFMTDEKKVNRLFIWVCILLGFCFYLYHKLETSNRQLKSSNKRLQIMVDAIRCHRDQRLDDRCWIDDYDLYAVLPEGLEGQVDIRQLPPEEMLKNCRRYVGFRQITQDPKEALRLYREFKEREFYK